VQLAQGFIVADRFLRAEAEAEADGFAPVERVAMWRTPVVGSGDAGAQGRC
jgi:hypothetical protein